MNDIDFLCPPANQHNQGVINWKVIFRVLGILLFIEAGLMLTCIGISWAYSEKETIYFFYTILINMGVGGLLFLIGRNADPALTRRDAYCIVSFAWILFTSFGMLPFWLSGKIPSVTDAFFETMSGFTTTGASVLDNIESLPHSMLFWRSLIQWIGGLGIVFFTIALLPFASGGSTNLYFAEATGVKHGIADLCCAEDVENHTMVIHQYAYHQCIRRCRPASLTDDVRFVLVFWILVQRQSH